MHHYPCYYTKQLIVTYSYTHCPGKAAINISTKTKEKGSASLLGR